MTHFQELCARVWRAIRDAAPPEIRECLEESRMGLWVVDRPPDGLLDQLGLDRGEDLPAVCLDGSMGAFDLLGSGEAEPLPGTESVVLFRSGFDPDDEEPAVERRVASVLVHELAYHFGFGEEMRLSWETRAQGVG